MSVWRDLRLQLCAMKCCGLLVATYEPQSNSMHSNRTLEIGALLQCVCVQLIAYGMLAYWTFHMGDFNIEYNNTGNIYLSMEFCMCCYLIAGINLHFYRKRREHNTIVQRVLHMAGECSVSFKDIYILYASLVGLCALTYSMAFAYAKLTVIVLVGYVGMFTSNFAVCGCLIAYYSCVHRVLASTLHCVNEDLLVVLNNSDNVAVCVGVKCCMRRFYSVLDFCDHTVNRWYGRVLLFITAYMLFSAPAGPFFLITVSFEKSNMIGFMMSSVTSVLWCCPWILIYVKALSSNGVYTEYCRTVKIISNIQGSSKEMDKMIEKFLLIHIKKKPLLTAYGFFALNRVTLFKIFTEIFTYLAILVQFKTMENALKNHTKEMTTKNV